MTILPTGLEKCPNCGKKTLVDHKRTHLKKKQLRQEYIYTHWKKCTNCRYIWLDNDSKISPHTFKKTFGQKNLF